MKNEKEALAKIEKDNAKKREEAKGLDARIRALKGEIDALEAAKNEVESSIAHLTPTVSSHEARARELEAELDTTNNTLRAAQQAYADLSAEIEHAKIELAGITAEQNNVVTRTKETVAAVENAGRQRAAMLDTEIAQKTEQLKAGAVAIVELENKRVAAERSYQDIASKLDAVRDEVATNASEVLRLEHLKKSIEDNVASLLNEEKRLKGENARLNSEAVALEESIETKRKELVEAENSLQVKLGELDTAEKKLISISEREERVAAREEYATRRLEEAGLKY